MNEKKIFYISGTRADYGVMRSILKAIHNDPDYYLTVVVTGMHLMAEYGNTIDEIKKDRFGIHICKNTFKEDSPESMAKFIGNFILSLTGFFQSNRPDMIILTGDRCEMLAAAIAATYLQIPIMHIAGGEVTSTVDEHARHAITKLSHIHCTSTKKSRQRVIKMGENPKNVHVVGSPGLEAILNEPLIEREQIASKYGLNLKKPVILVIQHPVSTEFESAGLQIKETLEALAEIEQQTIIVYPNADAGGRMMIDVIDQYRRLPYVQVHKNIPHTDYLSLLRIASVLVGNSSSGIVEAPSFHLPVINIGTRQEGRERARYVMDVPYKKNEIKIAIEKAIYDSRFRRTVKKCVNPYGDGKTSKNIIKILNDTTIDSSLFQKKLFY